MKQSGGQGDQAVRAIFIIKGKMPQENALFQINLPKKTFQPCQICNEIRYTEKCHIIPRECDCALKRMKMYKQNLIILCPSHHIYFDEGLLTKDEFFKIAEQVYKITYKYITSYKRWERYLAKGLKEKGNVNFNGSIFDIDKLVNKIDRGLLRPQWLENLIKNN